MLARRDELLGWADMYRTRLKMGVAVGVGRRSVQAAHRAQSEGCDLIVVDPDDEVALNTMFARTAVGLSRPGVRDLHAAHAGAGSPLDVIARTIVDANASIVVVGLGGRRGVPPILVGNTADRVINRTSSSIMIVRAGGFTPIFDEADDDGSFFARRPSAVVTAVA